MIGSVICKRIAPVGDILIKLFPTGIIENLDKNNTYLFGAIDSSSRSLRGGCAFSLSNEIQGGAILHYVNVDQNARKQGIASKLLESSFKSLKAAGVKCVIYREASEVPIKLVLSYNFATNLGFIPITQDEKILFYNVETVLSGKFAMKMMNKMDSLKNVVRIEDYMDKRILRFNEVETHGYYRLDKGSFDTGLSGFYIKDDQIIGALKVVRQEKVLVLTDVFIENEYDNEDIYNSLMQYVLILAIQDAKTERIVIQPEGDERSLRIKSILGNPDEELPAIELIKFL